MLCHLGLPRWPGTPPALGIPHPPAGPVEPHQRDHLGALMDLACGAAHLLAHGRIGEPVRGLVVDGRGVILFGSGIQVLGAGNAEDLLDDVGNFPEHWTRDDGWHGARGSAPWSARSNHDSGLRGTMRAKSAPGAAEKRSSKGSGKGP